jgi:hypothetical protein
VTSGGTCSTIGTRVTSPSLLQKNLLGVERVADGAAVEGALHAVVGLGLAGF